jgi:hypothetical protein
MAVQRTKLSIRLEESEYECGELLSVGTAYVCRPVSLCLFLTAVWDLYVSRVYVRAWSYYYYCVGLAGSERKVRVESSTSTTVWAVCEDRKVGL